MIRILIKIVFMIIFVQFNFSGCVYINNYSTNGKINISPNEECAIIVLGVERRIPDEPIWVKNGEDVRGLVISGEINDSFFSYKISTDDVIESYDHRGTYITFNDINYAYSVWKIPKEKFKEKKAEIFFYVNTVRSGRIINRGKAGLTSIGPLPLSDALIEANEDIEKEWLKRNDDGFYGCKTTINDTGVFYIGEISITGRLYASGGYAKGKALIDSSKNTERFEEFLTSQGIKKEYNDLSDCFRLRPMNEYN